MGKGITEIGCCSRSEKLQDQKGKTQFKTMELGMGFKEYVIWDKIFVVFLHLFQCIDVVLRKYMYYFAN